MDFETLLRRFGILFSFCGITPFSTSTKNVPKFVEMFPAIFYLVFVNGLVGTGIYHRYQFTTSDGIIISLVAYTRISSEILLQLASVIQAMVFRKRLKKMCRTYDFIQNYMKTRMGHNVDFGAFQNKLFQLIVTVFVPYLTAFILRRAFINSAYFFSIFNNILAFFYLLSSLVQLHTIIHLELLRFFLTLMTQWLRKHVSNFSKSSLCDGRDLLKVNQLNGYNEVLQMKLIHFKLWKLSVNINRIFGWSLGIIIARNAIEIAYGVYCIFLYYVKGSRFVIILRKPCVSFNFCFFPNIFFIV